MFFNPQKYDFSRVGRLKLNTKLEAERRRSTRRCCTRQDFYEVISYLLKLRKNPALVDDIDHLGNRRVRSVGELLENQFRIGLVRMERAIKEKMSVYQEMATAMPHDLINAKPVMAAIREFFGSSQLSQFMDQTNPLSEVTHKRRLSALGPGGLSRERAGFEVRDVHPTHYGRICPIETPEGPNIGLISSLSCYARINDFGFIESPYRKVKDGHVLDYVDRHQRRRQPKYKVGDVVEADELVGADGRSKKKGVEFEPLLASTCRRGKRTSTSSRRPTPSWTTTNGCSRATRQRASAPATSFWRRATTSHFIDVSPKQLVSVAASLIPFLENDDANRALMGSNMQRQAVPLLRARAPFVGTGMEYITARDSGAVVVARRTGTVDYVDSAAHRRARRGREGAEGRVRQGDGRRHLPDDEVQAVEPEHLYQPAPHRPRRAEGGQGAGAGRRPVHRARRARAGPQRPGGVHAVARLQLRGRDPGLREDGEGRLLHLHPHRGVRDRSARHQARAGRNHPRHPERRRRRTCATSTRAGIIRIGAYVKPGDILVGKVTPKGETQLTPEEKLLRAIFGEKAGDVRDASLDLPAGHRGHHRRRARSSRARASRRTTAPRRSRQDELDMMEKNLQDEIRILHDEVKKRVVQHAATARRCVPICSTSTAASALLKQGHRCSRAEAILGRCRTSDGAPEESQTDDPRLEDDLRDARRAHRAPGGSHPAARSRRRRRRSAAATSCLRASSSSSRSTSR